VAAPPDLDVVVTRLDAGDSAKTIAADLGVTDRTIRNWLHAADLPLASSRSLERRRRFLADRVWLREQYVEQERRPSAIAKVLKLPTAEVNAALERFGIERAPIHPELTAEALRAAFAAGGTVSSIARAAGVERATVRRHMRRHGVVNPHAERGRRPAQLDDAVWLRASYVDGGMSMKAIGDEVGATAETVGRALARHGIERRRASRPPGPRVVLDEGWLRQRYEADRAPVTAIAAEAKVVPRTIARAVQRLGLTRTSMVRATRRPHPHADRPGGIDPVWLRKRYVDDGLTIAKIAHEAAVSTTTVHRALATYGIGSASRTDD
jgi:transposase-like protein